MKTFNLGKWFIGFEKSKGVFTINVDTPKPAIYNVYLGIIKSLSLYNFQPHEVVQIVLFRWVILIIRSEKQINSPIV